jgi:hypothetical protein
MVLRVLFTHTLNSSIETISLTVFELRPHNNFHPPIKVLNDQHTSLRHALSNPVDLPTQVDLGV